MKENAKETEPQYSNRNSVDSEVETKKEGIQNKCMKCSIHPMTLQPSPGLGLLFDVS
jgi:hypothetical protein